jgi:hypothetical protein
MFFQTLDLVVRFEAFTVVGIQIEGFRVVTLHSVVTGYHPTHYFTLHLLLGGLAQGTISNVFPYQ